MKNNSIQIIKILIATCLVQTQAMALNQPSGQQLEWVTTGVCNGCNLSNLDFSKYVSALNELPHISLKCANLSGSNFTGLSVKSIDLNCPNASATNFTNLSNANLANSNLPAGINFQGINITGTNFTGASLPGANFSNLNIGHLAAENAILNGAIFDGANLECSSATNPTCGSMLYGANLTGASFKGTNLTGADLGGSTLTGAIFSPTTILNNVEFNHAHAADINLSNINIGCISAHGTDFTGANFNGSNLTNSTTSCASSFKNAILNDASFNNATMALYYTATGTQLVDFSGAQLMGTTGLNGINTPYNNIMRIINSAAQGSIECNGCDLTGVDFTVEISSLFSGSNNNMSSSTQSLIQLMQGKPVSMQCAILDNANMIGLSTPKLDLSCQDTTGENTTSMMGTNLTDAQIPGALLQNATMSDAILDQANLTGAHLDHANLYNASLKNTNFTYAHLPYAGLGSNDLTGALFVEADLSNLPASITYSPNICPPTSKNCISSPQTVDSGLKIAKAETLTLAHFEGANLPGIDLSNMSGNIGQLHFGISQTSGKATNLSGAHFDNTDLSCGPNCGSSFNSANLTGATFNGTNLIGADFTGATLDNATFNNETQFAGSYTAHTKLDNISCHGTNFSGVSLATGSTNITMDNANCSGTSSSNAANFSNMNISNIRMGVLQAQYANFNGTTFTNTNLTNSNLSHTSFSDATWNGVNLDGVKLNYADLDNVQVQGAAITNINSSSDLTTDFSNATLDKYSNLWFWLGDTLNTSVAGNTMSTQCASSSQPICAAFCHMGRTTAEGNYEAQHVFNQFGIPSQPALNNQQAFTDYRCSNANGGPMQCCQQLVFDANMNASAYMNLPQFQQ